MKTTLIAATVMRNIAASSFSFRRRPTFYARQQFATAPLDGRDIANVGGSAQPAT